MQLPAMLQRQVLDRPVALLVVALEGVLHDLCARCARKLDRLIAAEGVNDVHVIGNQLCRSEGQRQRRRRVEAQDNDRYRHRI